MLVEMSLTFRGIAGSLFRPTFSPAARYETFRENFDIALIDKEFNRLGFYESQILVFFNST